MPWKIVSGRTGTVPVSLTNFNKSYRLTTILFRCSPKAAPPNIIKQKLDKILCWCKLLLSQVESSHSISSFHQIVPPTPVFNARMHCPITLPSTQGLNCLSLVFPIMPTQRAQKWEKLLANIYVALQTLIEKVEESCFLNIRSKQFILVKLL